MRIGTLLANIAETEGATREQWKAEFQERIREHKEKKLLMECYYAACAGRRHITLGRRVLPPECLENEGFYLRDNGCSFEYYFE